jgi:Domain of unknown function (DUF4401)
MSENVEFEKYLGELKSLAGTECVLDERKVEEDFNISKAYPASMAIKIVTIAGGILASMAFLGFIGISGILDSDGGMIIFGGLLIIGSVVMNKFYEMLIVDTFSISAFIIGIACISWGLYESGLDEVSIALFLAIIGLVTLFNTSNYVLGFVSILLITWSLEFVITEQNLIYGNHFLITAIALVLTFWMLQEAKIVSLKMNISTLYDPIRTGLIVSFAIGLYIIQLNFWGDMDKAVSNQLVHWLSSLVLIPLTIYAISHSLRFIQIKSHLNKGIILLCSLILLLPTALAPAISGSLLILFLCFLTNYKTGIAIAIASLLIAISGYYYNLDLTLFVKSIVMMVTGALFLIIFYFTRKYLTDEV